MSKFYEVVSASPLGEPWGEGGKNQTYWCQLEGIEHNVMINKQTPIQPGQQIYGDLITDDGKPFRGAKSEYFKFKGAMTPPGTPRPAPSTTTSDSVNSSAPVPQWFIPFGRQIEAIYKEVCLPAEGPLPLSAVESYQPEEPEQPAEISPEMKAKLDDIFGEES